jgi:hypothetical protein
MRKWAHGMKHRYTLPVLLLVLVVLAAGIVAAAGLLYRSQRESCRAEAEHEIAAVAKLKAGHIADWRGERLGDAHVQSRRAFLQSAVGRWLKDSGDASLRTEVDQNMESIRTAYGYANVIIASRDGKILFSLDPRLTVFDANAKQLVAQAISSRDAVFGDLFRCPACGEVNLDVAAAIYDADNQVVG